jgi:hypothetical protein
MFGHAWSTIAPSEDVVHDRHYRAEVSVECLRCETQRHDSYNYLGRLGHRRYIYPDGYREYGQTIIDEQRSGETRGQTVKRRFLLDHGLVPSVPEHQVKPRERKPRKKVAVEITV